ncbi:hypothetical protein [Actinoplanes sp. NPDC049681]|uniref:hypothetical protein n=1 Tax=Actinoplanes sp. NPDC049681 TaxID=3363905 RepID=UPI0037B92EC7
MNQPIVPRRAPHALEPVDVGGLDQAANVEGFARMNVNLGFGQGRGTVVYRYDTR